MIVFRNSGLIDIRAITTFGVSSKDSPSAIGHFGTGLKYAIAVLLRNGCKITIFCGTESYGFDVETARIRNDEFELITMNGTPLAFTTQLGRDWELWQAFRELYSNMLDEGGTCRKQDGVRPQLGVTTITISGAPFEEVWAERHKVFLQSDPICVTERLEIHPRPSKYLYYRGIRVMEFDKPTLFTYNILAKLELTEDRTVKHAWAMPTVIANLLSTTPDETIARKLVTAKDSPEADFRFNSGYNRPSDQFLDAVASVKSHNSLNSSAREAFNQYRVIPNESMSGAVLNYQQKHDLAEAYELCKSMGYDADEYMVIPTHDLPPGVLGKVKSGGDTIYISMATFDMGVRMVAGTLLEEYLHLKYDLPDCSRELQNFLLDKLMAAAERLRHEGFKVAA